MSIAAKLLVKAGRGLSLMKTSELIDFKLVEHGRSIKSNVFDTNYIEFCRNLSLINGSRYRNGFLINIIVAFGGGQQ